MKKNYTVTGMTCSACKARVERCVTKIEGVKNVTVNLISGNLSVDSDGDLTDKIFRAVKAEGYGIKDGSPKERDKVQAKKLLVRLYISVPLVIMLMYISMGHMAGLTLPTFLHKPIWFTLSQAVIALPVLIINGKYFSVGFKNLFKGSPNMDSLVALGSFVSFAYGVYAFVMIALGIDVEVYSSKLYFEGSAMILTVITLGKFLEEKSKNKTMGAVEKLLSLAPDTATVIIDGKETEINAEDLKIGDIVVLKNGYRVPADGEIMSGNGWADESVITGESLPVYKQTGDKVVCGTSFDGGFALFKAEKVGEDSTVYKIVKLVEEANSTKVPIARLADKIAGIFVPAVIGVSLLSFIIWLLVGASVQFAINIAVSVLVVSCPCALGLATPAALMAGTGKAAENGILIKSGSALQSLASVNSVVLDKTGTITFGNPEIDDYELIDGLNGNNFIGLCASLERKSSHILGKPIIELAKKLNAPEFEVENFESISGMGVKGVVADEEIVLGNAELMKKYSVDVSGFETETKERERNGATVLYCSAGGKQVGYISIKDKIKPTSKTAVEEFKSMGAEVVMLTGDSEAAAKAVANELGISYKAQVLPDGKHKEVKSLIGSGKTVMMVGDGVNDAPSLATATVGVAIGAGTDIAIESADVVLIKNDLKSAVDALKLGKAVIRNIKENLFWAFIYNIILIPIACGVLYAPFGITLSPMLGSMAMSLSSVFVVGNALRLRFIKFNKYNNEKGEEEMFCKKDITTVYIDGMMCEHCKKRVETVLSAFGKVKVDLENKSAEIVGCSASDEEIEKAIEDAGYKVVKILK